MEDYLKKYAISDATKKTNKKKSTSNFKSKGFNLVEEDAFVKVKVKPAKDIIGFGGKNFYNNVDGSSDEEDEVLKAAQLKMEANQNKFKVASFKLVQEGQPSKEICKSPIEKGDNLARVSEKWKSPDLSPDRNSRNKRSEKPKHRESVDNSPQRRKRDKSADSSPQRRKRDKSIDNSPKRRKRDKSIDNSPKRRKHDKSIDNSPKRRNRKQSFDNSPKRMRCDKSIDNSPKRRNRDEYPK